MNASVALPVVLLVEDNPGDVELVRDALERITPATRLVVAADGAEALGMLRRESPHREAPRPALVLLDLNLPKVNGREVLSALRADPRTRALPVVVFTSSDAEEDVREAYDGGANTYVTKPARIGDLEHTLRVVLEYWLSVARLQS